MKEFHISGEDFLKLHVVCWDQVENPVGVIQLSHGMAEHILRYSTFANFLNERGWIVYGHDHRGHGQSVSSTEDLGFFSESSGWQKLIEDLKHVNDHIQENHPHLPVFIFGHSMGSFALRHYIGLYGNTLKGAIICGTGNNPNWLSQTALLLAKWEVRRRGPRHRSNLMTGLSFGNFNKKFQPNKTEFDWLTRDEVEVFKYIEDPLCGQVFTSSFYLDFLGGILELSSMTHIEKTPKTLPLYFISGECDPLAQEGKAIVHVFTQYKNAGVITLDMKLYPEARHELLNEKNKLEVYEDVVKWLEKNIQ